MKMQFEAFYTATAKSRKFQNTRCDLSPDSFVLVLRYCANLKAIRYESTSLNRIAADNRIV